MSEKLQRNYALICVGVLILMSILAVALGNATLKPEASLQAKNASIIVSTVILRGNRGKILGSRGEPLAFDEQTYAIQFRRDDSERKDEKWRPFYTSVFQNVVALVESHGRSTIDVFAIHYDPSSNSFHFDWGYTGIDDQAEHAAAMKKRETNWRKNMQVRKIGDREPTPEEIYDELRTRFYIPEELDYYEARKLLSIWQEIQLGSAKVNPILIASDVPIEAVVEIESRPKEYDSIMTIETTRRVYPKSSLVANIIGYTGRINTEDNFSAATNDAAFVSILNNGKLLGAGGESGMTLEEQGYNINDTVGKAGLEKTQEALLTGSTTEHHGKISYKVSMNRVIHDIIEQKAPTDGNNVYLTLDLPLQEVVAKAVEDNVQYINDIQTAEIIKNQEKYIKLARDGDLANIKKAETVVGIVLDAKTGDVLAMVDYPSYDNNLFVNGLSVEDSWILTDPREPLFNKSTKSKLAPGSIFKMAVGLAGLEEDAINLKTLISDEGPYSPADDKTGELLIKKNQPKCWTSAPHTHTDQDIVLALKNSCNYFFFETSFRLSKKLDRLGRDVSLLSKWAGDNLGLAQPTGIEIDEVVGQIGGQEVLYDNTLPIGKGIGAQKTYTPSMVYRAIWRYLKDFAEGYNIQDVDLEKKCKEAARQIVNLVKDKDATELGVNIREIIMDQIGIPMDYTKDKGAHQQINDMLGDLRWNVSETVRTSIGQSKAEVTPLAAARYVAALVNGGKLMETHVIDRIVKPNGTVVTDIEPVVIKELDVHPENLAAIKEGMKEVFSLEDGGTAGEAFVGFKYKDDIGGKTGTAQTGSLYNNIDIENTSWMVAFAPYDDPEIVVVICVPNGFKGSLSAPSVRTIVEYWMTRKNEGEKSEMPMPYAILK